jgi:hypothetical protein
MNLQDFTDDCSKGNKAAVYSFVQRTRRTELSDQWRGGMCAAAAGGYKEVAELLWNNVLGEFPQESHEALLNTSMFLACWNAHVHVSRWILSLQQHYKYETQWDKLVYAVCHSGDTDILIWLLENHDQPWNRHKWQQCFENVGFQGTGMQCKSVYSCFARKEKLVPIKTEINWNVVLDEAIRGWVENFPDFTNRIAEDYLSTIRFLFCHGANDSVRIFTLPPQNQLELLHIFSTLKTSNRFSLVHLFHQHCTDHVHDEYLIWRSEHIRQFNRNVTFITDLHQIIMEYLTVH